MNVLVTGGTGVVGVAAITALLRAGHKVRLLSRHAEHDAQSFPAHLGAGPGQGSSPDVEPWTLDLTDASPDQLVDAVRGCQAVLHIAGIVEESPPEVTFDRVNVEATRRLRDAAAQGGGPRFVLVSSLGADRGHSMYHESKRRAEALVEPYPGEWLIVRSGGVYGPGDETISPLLKMVRTLPAVPMVAGGDQPFQPVWHADLGEMLAAAVTAPGRARQILEVAGPDVTTTDAVLALLSEITGRPLPRLAVPVWVTEVGIQALEAFGGAGRRLLQRAGIEAPVNSAKLDMLLEENVISAGRKNALPDFVAAPTRLRDGLEMLVDAVPEQLPGDGIGPVRASTFSAEIAGCPLSATQLLDRVCEQIRDVMPAEFAAEPAVAHQARPGATMTGRLPGRGHFQVKLDQRTGNRATFVTAEGHPLAGLVQLHAEDIPEGVRFSVHLAAQPATALDWLAMQTIGGRMQRTNWRGLVRRVVELSGGRAPRGIHHEAHVVTPGELRDLRMFGEQIVQEQERLRRAAEAMPRG